VPPYVVLHDSHLRAIAAQRPVTLESLAKLPGIGPKRLEKYGDELVALVRKAQKGR
jgi:ATP-dependent DNA helicase RecQ